MTTVHELDHRQVRALVARLADPGISADEAYPLLAVFEGREQDAVLPLFGLLHDSREPAVVRVVSRIMGRWNELPVARALIPALERLLGEQGVGALNKMAAAGLLELFGEPVDYARWAEEGEPLDLPGLSRSSLEIVLETGGRPLALSRILEKVAEMGQDIVLALIDDLTLLADARAEPLLAALCHAGPADVAVSAVAALDQMGLHASHDALVRVAAHHHDATVRAQAALTLERLAARPDRGAAEALAAERRDGLVLEAHGHLAEGEDRQFLVLTAGDEARRGYFDVYAAVLDARRGIRSYAISEGLSAAAVAQLREQFAQGDRALAPLRPARAHWALQEAANRALAYGDTRIEVVHVAWLRALGRVLGGGE
jgi:hypothetical protein